MKKILVTAALFLVGFAVQAQDKFMCRNANVYFNADGPTEKIEAKNGQGASVLDTKTGYMEFMVALKAFEFEKALMQEHFNENYVESDKFPKVVFKGTIQDFSKVNFKKDGVYPVQLKGKMTLHGVTNDMTADGTLEVKGGSVTGKSKFTIKCSDYKIEIPSLVKDKVNNVVTIQVTAPYKPM
jgi:polyisoprenoid-binding protein YceI